MSKTKLITVIVIAVSILIILILSLISSDFRNWILLNWVDLILAVILAIVAAMAVEYIYKKNQGKSNLSRTTMAQKPRRLLAKLILPDDKEFTINQYQRIFGREDFVGLLVVDDLLYIGKNHFKLTRMDDGFYIEDLDTKNGTQINEEDIHGLGKIKLKNNDQITVAKILNINYIEEDQIN